MMDPACTPGSGVENPYVAVVSKKYRNLKKKADKVSKLHLDLQSGKDLNVDQLQTIKTLGELERSLADIEAIKYQLEEVANSDVPVAHTRGASATSEICVGTTDTSKVAISKAAKARSAVTTSTFSTHATTGVGVCYDNTKDASINITTGNNSGNTNSSEGDNLRRLMEVFHVCANYEARVTDGSFLPAEVDYFGKSLLGQTSVLGYADTLNKSCEAVSQYLAKSDTEIIMGVTYKGMNAQINALAAKISDRVHASDIDPVPVPASASVPAAVPMEEENDYVFGSTDGVTLDWGKEERSKPVRTKPASSSSSVAKGSPSETGKGVVKLEKAVSFSASTKLGDTDEIRFSATMMPGSDESSEFLESLGLGLGLDGLEDTSSEGNRKSSGRSKKGGRTSSKKHDFNATQLVTEPPVRRVKPEKDKYGNVVESADPSVLRVPAISAKAPSTRLPKAESRVSVSPERVGKHVISTQQAFSYAHVAGGDPGHSPQSQAQAQSQSRTPSKSKIPAPAQK